MANMQGKNPQQGATTGKVAPSTSSKSSVKSNASTGTSDKASQNWKNSDDTAQRQSSDKKTR